MLTIYIDFKCPASFLAFEPARKMIAETGIAAQWLPFAIRSETIPEPQRRESVGDRHRRVRAEQRRATHLFYADLHGRQMRFADTPAGSDTALAALAMIDGDPLPFIAAAFDGYWVDGADLEDKKTVSDLLRSSGTPILDFADGRDRLAALRDTAIDALIFATPTFVIDEQRFVGREHLPWIRELIAQSRPPSPLARAIKPV